MELKSKKKMTNILEKIYTKEFVACVIITIFSCLFTYWIIHTKKGGSIPVSVIAVVTVIIFLVNLFWGGFYIKKNGITKQAIFFAFYLGMLLRFFYIALTPGDYFQNDLGHFSEGDIGHLGYIHHIATTGKLPDLPPHLYGQFYHPPFYYIISAIVAKIVMMFGVDMGNVDEILQFVSLFYSGVLIFYLDKIAKVMNISLNGRFVAMILITFLPYNVMMSGALNNDLLMYTLSTMGVYYILRWYSDCKWKHIIITSVCIGLAMMTKISAVLLVPGIIVLIVYKIWTVRKQIKKYFMQVISFGLISMLLGLWSSLYNYIVYGTPLGFVPVLSDQMEQFIGQYTKWQRLFDFKGVFNSIIISWSRYDEYVEYNIWGALVKYAVSGEGFNVYYNFVISIVAHICFYLTIVIFLIIVLSFVNFIFFQKKDVHIKLFFGLSIALIMWAYIKFCFSHTHVCTMHIRYIMMAYYMGALLCGKSISNWCEKYKETKRKQEKAIRVCSCILCLFYMIITILLYTNLELII